MTAPNAPDLGQEPADSRQHTADLAKNIASKMVEGLAHDQEPEPQQLTPEPVEAEVAQPDVEKSQSDELETAEAVDEPVEEEGTEEESTYTPEVVADLETTLRDNGIDLGVKMEDFPADFQHVYVSMLQSAVGLVSEVTERDMEASQAIQQVSDFRKKLTEQPDKVLLAFALQFPDLYQKIADVNSRMAEDETYRQSVMRELEADARLAEAERKERLYAERDNMTKARRFTAETHRAAIKHGVDPALAEQVVALSIRANNGNLDISAVDKIVADVGKKSPKRAAPKQRVVSAQQAEARKSAPSQPTPTSPPPKSSPGLEEGVDRQRGGGQFRSLVRDAFRKVTSVDR